MNTTKKNVVSLLDRLDRFERQGIVIGENNVLLSVLGNKRRTATEVVLKIEGHSTNEVKLKAVQIVQLIELLDDYLDDLESETV